MKKRYRIGIVVIIAIIIITTIVICVSYQITKYTNDVSSSQQKKLTKYDMIDYFVKNLDEYKVEIEKQGYQCEIVNEAELGKQVTFLQIKIDNTTKIKFQSHSRSIAVDVIRSYNTGVEVTIALIGVIPNDIQAIVSTNGGSSCDYENANNFNTPTKQQGLKDATELDSHIKAFISTEELNELRDKSYSVYNDLMEIYKEKVNIDTK